MSGVHRYQERRGLDWCRICTEDRFHSLHALEGTVRSTDGWVYEEAVVRLVKITEKLYVNPERVISVEERTLTRDSGPYTFTELTLETQTRWRVDLPLEDVVAKVDLR